LKKTKLKIVLLGSGNLSYHLGKALSALAGYPLVQLYARSSIQARLLGTKFHCNSTHSIEEIDGNAGLYLLCISDDQIEKVAGELVSRIPRDAVVAHTSGSTSSRNLGKFFSNFGVMYPLQTFTKSRKITFNSIPWFITGSNKKSTDLLTHTAGLLSSNVRVVDDATRLKIHLAAVLVNNFPNFIYDLVYRFMEARGLKFNLLLPLLNETLEKIKSMQPALAQTGPAKRHDQGVIDRHLEILKKEKEEDLYQIYELFSRLIWKHHNQN